MSVTVVRMIDEAVAGSRPLAVSSTGIMAPAVAASTIEITIEMPMISANAELPLNRSTGTAVTTATTTPLAKDALASLNNNGGQWRARISRSARARQVTAKACAPVLPDCPATIGNKTASAV